MAYGERICVEEGGGGVREWEREMEMEMEMEMEIDAQELADARIHQRP